MQKIVIAILVAAGVFAVATARPQFLQQRSQFIPILRFANDLQPDGHYNYAYETGNGIAAEEAGAVRDENSGTAARGQFHFTDPQGQVHTLSYTADENGFRPSADYLPTPPPTPDYILRSLAFNEQQERLGLVRDQ